MALQTFQAFVAGGDASDAQRVLNHAWWAKGQGTRNFYAVEVDPDTGAFPVEVIPTTLTIHNNIYYPYSGGAVTTLAYTTILASTGGVCQRMWIQDTSGSMLILATGAAGLEVPLFYVQAGGFSFAPDVYVAAGTRLSIKALDATANSGAFLATIMG